MEETLGPGSTFQLYMWPCLYAALPGRYEGKLPNLKSKTWPKQRLVNVDRLSPTSEEKTRQFKQDNPTWKLLYQRISNVNNAFVENGHTRVIEQHVLDTYAGKQLSYAATDV